MRIAPNLPRDGSLTRSFVLIVFGLPADVVAAALAIDPSEVEKISELVGTLLRLIPDNYLTL